MRAIDEKLKKESELIIRLRTIAVNKILALRKKMKPLGKITIRELIDEGIYR